MGGSLLSSPITTVGVIAFVLVTIILGGLVPRPIVKMLLKSKDDEITMWKQIAKDRGEVSQTALGYAQDSLDINRTAVRALDALAQVADQGDADASVKAS